MVPVGCGDGQKLSVTAEGYQVKGGAYCGHDGGERHRENEDR